jgi:hypothetical protein
MEDEHPADLSGKRVRRNAKPAGRSEAVEDKYVQTTIICSAN